LGIKRDQALFITGLTRHQYYYKPKFGKRGRKATSQTACGTQWVDNSRIVDAIKTNQKDLDLDYGYRKMTIELQLQGYEIGKHKTYRLMKEHLLLHEKKKFTNKKYVKYRKVYPLEPFKLMEMDIKFVWIESRKCHAYILTILDIFSRKALKWVAAMSITQHTVAEVWSKVVTDYLQPRDLLKKGIHIEVRNDNDKRFSAKKVQQFFADNYLDQVFTHPYTPQENGHVESFHAILGKSMDRYYFNTIDELIEHLTLFYDKYNNERLHSSIAKLPPNIYLEQWDQGNIMLCVDTTNKKIKSKLTIPYSQVRPSGHANLRERSCLDYEALEELNKPPLKAGDVTTLNQPSVQRSPSVASC